MSQVPWQAAAVETCAVSSLLPYANNARTHSPEQVAQIAASIAEFGFTVPVLMDERGVLVAGHGRILAARTLGLDVVPAIRLGHLSEAQLRAYRLADNQLALNAGWDDVLLAQELRGLRDDGYDLSVVGFGVEELDRLLAFDDDLVPGIDGRNPDAAAPEPPEVAVSRPGDLWRLGQHRLLCGDATAAGDVSRLLDGTISHLMVSDPPYGVEYDPAWRNAAGVSTTARVGRVANDDRADWRQAWALFPGQVAYIWHGAVHARLVIESLEAADFVVRSQIVWAKSRFALGRGDYHWQHESCFYLVRRGGTGHWQGARDQSTLWAIGFSGEEDAATVHGTQKPVECMRRPILNNSASGDAVYDPFLGSGTTLIAAEVTGRRCHGLEIDPRYVDVAVRRWQTLTGRRAVLAGDGRTIDAVAAARGLEVAT